MARSRLFPTNALRQAAYRQRQRTPAYFRQSRDEWETPQAFFNALDQEFHFTLDVCASPANAKCAKFYTREGDGIQQPWSGVCWMNPPYGRDIARWVRKACESALQGATVVGLVPSRTDTRWWHTWVMPYAEIRFVPGRLKFSDAVYNAPFPCAVIIYPPPIAQARRAHLRALMAAAATEHIVKVGRGLLAHGVATVEQRQQRAALKERDMMDALWTLQTLIADFGYAEVYAHVLQPVLCAADLETAPGP